MNSMNKGYHIEIPIIKLLRFLIGFSFVLQLLIITNNHFNGYSVLSDYTHFLTKIIISTVLTLIASLMIALPDLYVIKQLNIKFPWKTALHNRLLIQSLLVIVIAVCVSIFITLVSHLLHPYENGLLTNFYYNGLIVSVCNILLMITLEAWLLFIESNDSKAERLQLQKELSQMRFEILKNQINPHFMFNSLNVLSVLIEKDAKRAQRFVDEFSKIYRYVLETIEKPLVSVQSELEFLRSFMFLQQLRHAKALVFEVDLPSNILEYEIPPFALQVVAENACKHNIISIEQPLRIQVTSKKDRIIIANTFQPKDSGASSSKVGQKNLIKRYQQIGVHRPTFRILHGTYTASLPLINQQSNEDSYH